MGCWQSKLTSMRGPEEGLRMVIFRICDVISIVYSFARRTDLTALSIPKTASNDKPPLPNNISSFQIPR